MFNATTTAAASCLLVASTFSPAFADSPQVLFIRGAERSGGFLEAQNDAQRTEQLADISNVSTDAGNHGWATFADTLREAGFEASQVSEPLEADAPAEGQTQGAALPLTEMDLNVYDVIVFASNNARYSSDAVDAVEQYLRQGGGAIFISDANFGGDWNDASASDQPFLDRLGLQANQDRGTYVLRRDDGEFLQPNHPILENVSAFDGEGVTPATVREELPEGVTLHILALAKENVHRPGDDASRKRRGEMTPATERDAVLVAGTIGEGRFVYHFDRNTFFNKGGAGTDLTRFDNRQFALNLFNWVAGQR